MQWHQAGPGTSAAVSAMPREAGRAWRAVLRGLLMLAALVLAGLLVRSLPGLRHALFDGVLLRRGLTGRLVFLGIGTLICASGLPRQAVGFAGGFAYGPLLGTLLTTLATTAGCLVDFYWARLVGRDWARRRLLRGRAARLDGFVARNPFSAVLTLRLLPVGSSLMLSLLAGVLDVAVMPFTAASALGSLPQTVIFALVGSGTRIGESGRIGLGALLFIASGVLGVVLMRRALPRG